MLWRPGSGQSPRLIVKNLCHVINSYCHALKRAWIVESNPVEIRHRREQPIAPFPCRACPKFAVVVSATCPDNAVVSGVIGPGVHHKHCPRNAGEHIACQRASSAVRVRRYHHEANQDDAAFCALLPVKGKKSTAKCRLYLVRPPPMHAIIKNSWDVAHSIVQILGVTIGALWACFRFWPEGIASSSYSIGHSVLISGKLA